MKPQALSSHVSSDSPSPWVQRFAPLIASGEVLDLACGGGRHSRFLAALGYTVLAVDRDLSSLNLNADSCANAHIVTQALDLETGGASSWPFAPARFNGMVVTHYLHRPLFPFMVDSLVAGGILIYETFAVGNEQFGKPSNPAFLLARGELLEVAARYGFDVIAFEEGIVTAPRPAMLQRICMAKPDSAGEARASTRFSLD